MVNISSCREELRIKLAINPLYVKRTKVLEDNSQTKNDVKDARTLNSWSGWEIAEPTIPQGVLRPPSG